jgi:hypothetical protein
MPFFTVAHRAVQHRVSMTGHAELSVTGVYLVALAGNAGAIQCIAESGAVQRQRARHKCGGRIWIRHKNSIKVK